MRELGGPAQVVRFYVLTCSARITEGLYHLPIGIIVHDTGMDPVHVDKGMAQLEEAGLVLYDADAEVVLDCTALKFHPLQHGRGPDGELRVNKAMVNAVKLFGLVPDTPLKRTQVVMARQYAPDFAAELVKEFPDMGDLPRSVSPMEGGSMGDREGGSMGGEREEKEHEYEKEKEASQVKCSYCPDPALVQGGGEVASHEGLPWCTWCEVAE